MANIRHPFIAMAALLAVLAVICVNVPNIPRVFPDSKIESTGLDLVAETSVGLDRMAAIWAGLDRMALRDLMPLPAVRP